jgi:hypothetical protein
MTTTYIPTVGEYAERALASFTTLQNAANLPQNESSGASRGAAVELVRACLALMRKFPAQARMDFASVLPFTRLELELIVRGVLDDRPVADAIARRLLEWARKGPVIVDEANVDAADFLTRLTPLLDLWSQRQQAASAAERLGRD